MFFSAKKVLGLDIGSSSIKVAEVDASRSGATLQRFHVYPLQPGIVTGGEIQQTAVVSQIIADCLQAMHSSRKSVASGLWGTSTIVKKISLPRMDEKLVAEQIKWEAEQYIPFDINEISLEYHILKNMQSSPDSMDVLLIGAKQETVFRYLEAIESAGIKCAILDVNCFALANCFELNYGRTQEPTALLDIGGGVTNVVVIDQGEVIFCRDVGVGGLNFTQDIQRGMGVSFTEAEALKISASHKQEVPEEVNSLIRNTLETVVEEIRSSFEFFTATTSGATIRRIYITGGAAQVPGLSEALARVTQAHVEWMNPLQKVKANSKHILPEALSQLASVSAVALGLGLRQEADV